MTVRDGNAEWRGDVLTGACLEQRSSVFERADCTLVDSSRRRSIAPSPAWASSIPGHAQVGPP
jgi:hypothetical protein